MRWRVALCGALCVLAAGSARAEVRDRDPAELLPPQTLAYLELHQAGQLARELAALLKGSALEDLLASLVKVQTDNEEAEGVRWNRLVEAELALLLSPEALAEAGRLQGGAVALTGFTKDGEEEYVAVLLTGESHLPAFALRVLLLDELKGRLREVARVDKVPLYQAYARVEKEEEGKDERRSEIIGRGPVFAFTRGLVAVGSSKEAVRDAVTRFQGKDAGPTLASRDGFKAASRLRQRPGLFVYADLPALAAVMDRPDQRLLSEYEWKFLKTLVNPKAARTLGAHLALHKGELALRAEVQFEKGQSSPLLDLLSDQAVTLDALAAVPADSLAALTMKLPDGGRRWDKLVGLFDGFAKATGTPDEVRPSLTLRQREAEAKVSAGKAFAQVEAVTLAYHRHEKLGKDKDGTPLLIVQARSEAAAKELEEALPRLLTLIGDVERTPQQETVEGVRVRSLEARPFDAPFWYGRQGSHVVFSLEPLSLAQSLRDVAAKRGLATQGRVKESVQKAGPAVVLGLVALDRLLAPLLEEVDESLPDGKGVGRAIGAAPDGKGVGRAIGEAIAGLTGGAIAERDQNDKTPPAETPARKQLKELTKTLQSLPPLTLALTRQPETLTLEVRPVALRPIVVQTINAFFAAAVESELRGPCPPFPSGCYRRRSPLIPS